LAHKVKKGRRRHYFLLFFPPLLKKMALEIEHGVLEAQTRRLLMCAVEQRNVWVFLQMMECVVIPRLEITEVQDVVCFLLDCIAMQDDATVDPSHGQHVMARSRYNLLEHFLLARCSVRYGRVRCDPFLYLI